MQSATIATGDREMTGQSQWFEDCGYPFDSEPVFSRMVRAACIDIEHGVAGLMTEPDAIEVTALQDEPVSERMARFSFPVWLITGVGVWSV